MTLITFKGRLNILIFSQSLLKKNQ